MHLWRGVGVPRHVLYIGDDAECTAASAEDSVCNKYWICLHQRHLLKLFGSGTGLQMVIAAEKGAAFNIQ